MATRRGALFLIQQLFTCRGLKKGRGRGLQPGRCPSQPPRSPPPALALGTHLLSRRGWRAVSPTRTWTPAPPRPGGGAPGRAGARSGKRGVGVRARGSRSARLGRPLRGSRPGPPDEARRPPPAGRGARGARSPPCAAPGGPAEAGARRAGEGTPSPGPAGSRSGRGDALRRAGRAEGGRRAAARREGGENRGGRTPPAPLWRTLRRPLGGRLQFLRFPEALRGLAQVLEIRLRALLSRCSHHSHLGVGPGPETPFSALKSLGDLRPSARRNESGSSLSNRVM